MIAHIVCGAPHAWLDVNEISSSPGLTIGVDRGALLLIEQQIIPQIAIGDFDSISEAEYQQILGMCKEVIKLNCEKNETDTEVALNYCISNQINEVYLYGGLGGRFDHSIANIRLLLQFVKKGLRIHLLDQTNCVSVLPAGNHRLKALPKRYLSFFALESDVSELTLEGLKYPLNDYYLSLDDIRCVSNEILGESFTIRFNQGYLLMINSEDEATS